MNDRDKTPDVGDETISFSNEGLFPPPPSSPTGPIFPPDGPNGSSNRIILVLVLVFAVGIAAGFGIAQFFKHVDKSVPDPSLVFYEDMAMTFPLQGAEFTKSSFDLQTGKCDADIMKRELKSDKRRFNAWLDLEEIKEADFDAFVNRLSTRILEKATPVEDHGCFPSPDTCSFAIQAVLGPGTPAWFDPVQARIVAKCTSSSPLREPRCPPNCEEIPTPTPTPSPTPSPSPTPRSSTSPRPHHSSTPRPSAHPSSSPEPSPTDTPIFETPSPLPTDTLPPFPTDTPF